MPPSVRDLASIVASYEEVVVAYLFGSVAAGRDRARSDVDVAILLGAPLAAAREERLRSDLEAAAHRRVDLVVLDHVPPLLAREVVTTGQVLLCRDEDRRARFELCALSRYLDTHHLRQVQMAYLRERIEARSDR